MSDGEREGRKVQLAPFTLASSTCSECELTKSGLSVNVLIQVRNRFN